MQSSDKDLILAAEIAGFLHDLGKLYPEFAREFMSGGVGLEKAVKKNLQSVGFDVAHGAILEAEHRAYPPQNTHDWLQQIKSHSGWQSVLKLPESWVQSGTIQAQGLGEPLRQHHTNNDFQKHFNKFSILGDLYTFGADTRDSALDKGSGDVKSGKQALEHGFISDSFGRELKSYGPDVLQAVWEAVAEQLPALLFDNTSQPWQNPVKTRQQVFEFLQAQFRQALGETRRPTHDVTLWHHSFSTASMFKAAVAEGVLKQNFKDWQEPDGLFDFKQMGRVRFRLLGVRWDWLQLTQGALKPVVYSALAEQKDQAIQAVRELLEQQQPIGNCIYQDDAGAVFVVPGFYCGATAEQHAESERLFTCHILDALQDRLLNRLAPLGAGTPIRLAWTQPMLYLTDYPEVLAVTAQADGQRQRLLQVGLPELKADWAKQSGQAQVCPQCGLRPAIARELEVYQSGLDDDNEQPQGWCGHCESLVSSSQREKRRRFAQSNFGFEPQTFNLQAIRQQRNGANNARVVLVSLQINAEDIASGEALVTQLARPFEDIRLEGEEAKNLNHRLAAGDYLQDLWTFLHTQPADEALATVIKKQGKTLHQVLLGDKYWLGGQDGRMPDSDSVAEQGIALAEQFFLREAIPEQAGLCRHVGDRLLLFGMRKHASPARLTRIWDDLKDLWRQVLVTAAELTDSYIMPVSLDARGVRFLVAAEDAGPVLLALQKTVDAALQKLRGGLAPQLSVLVMRDKFPLYVAMDALRRMENRPRLRQTWTLRNRHLHEGHLQLNWDTPQGSVLWQVDTTTGDPNQADIWHPHVICSSRPEGPGRLVLMTALQVGEHVDLPVADFDFAVLDSTARRYELAYDAQGRRAHFILGRPGRSAYLWERLEDVLLTLPQVIGSWNPSQSKALIGQIIECYEKWVRDVPPALQDSGRDAWHQHVRALLTRVSDLSAMERDHILATLDDGLFFDAFEWSGFVVKSRPRSV